MQLLKTSSLLLMLLTCLIFHQNVYGQNKLRTIGLGIELSQIELFELFSLNAAPGKNISITINASDNFRIEPFFGFAKYSSEDSLSDSRSKSTRFGLSVYGMKRVEKLNYLYGLRLDKINSRTSYRSEFYNEKTNTKGFSWGPEIGAEYMLSEQFSFSTMVGFVNMNLTNKEDDLDADFSGWHSETSIYLRYYF
jgi:hypothetical protein